DVLQVFGNLASRNGAVQRFGVRQVASALRGEAALAGQAACDLAGTVSAEIEVNDRIVAANGRHRSAAIVNAGEGNDELVGHVAVVRVFDALDGIDKFTAFSFAGNHGIKGLELAVPFLVAIHGLIAAAH